MAAALTPIAPLLDIANDDDDDDNDPFSSHPYDASFERFITISSFPVRALLSSQPKSPSQVDATDLPPP